LQKRLDSGLSAGASGQQEGCEHDGARVAAIAAQQACGAALLEALAP